MANVYDYINWRGDLSLKVSPFNDIDNLILSRFSYFPFDTIMKENEVVTIKELGERFLKEDIKKMAILWPNDEDFFPLMAQSKRFGNMKVTKYINHVNVEQDKQFSAITIIMPDDTLYVAYRGTDDTIVGWKEDFMFSFEMHTASQKDSVKYLEEVGKKFRFNKIRIGGHSKGGNLAVYAAIFANSKLKKRIIDVYCNDGPGFLDEIVETKEYNDIIGRVHTFVPQSSIIGRILNHKEKFNVVESTQTGIMQHDLYTWQILGTKFVNAPELTQDSELVNKTINDWLERIDINQRKQVIDAIFDIMLTTDSATMKDLKENKYEKIMQMLQSYKNLDAETKKMIFNAVSEFFNVTKDNLMETLPKKQIKITKSKKNVDKE